MQQFAPPLVESDLKEIKTCLKRPRAQNDIQVFSGNTSFSDGQTVHQAEVGCIIVTAWCCRGRTAVSSMERYNTLTPCRTSLYAGYV